MKTYTSLNSAPQNNRYLSLAIGNFDGVHQGHKELLRDTINDAKTHNGIAGIFTFWPHPLKTLKKQETLKLLTSLERKQQLIEQAGIDIAFFISFSKEIKELSPREFAKQVLVDKLRASSVHVGFNFSFGKNAQGDVNDLRNLGTELGFNVSILPEFKIAGQTVSSTLVRHCIEDGEIEEANKFLGYAYQVSGTVESGDQRGRQIGYPTANLAIDKEIIIPARGVYATYVDIGNTSYKAVVNIGNKPTFSTNNEETIEAHILDYQGNLYGHHMKVEFIKRLRVEKKFASVEELVEQINIDVSHARKIL